VHHSVGLGTQLGAGGNGGGVGVRVATVVQGPRLLRFGQRVKVLVLSSVALNVTVYDSPS
jgi:hypothetical protein